MAAAACKNITLKYSVRPKNKLTLYKIFQKRKMYKNFKKILHMYLKFLFDFDFIFK